MKRGESGRAGSPTKSPTAEGGFSLLVALRNLIFIGVLLAACMSPCAGGHLGLGAAGTWGDAGEITEEITAGGHFWRLAPPPGLGEVDFLTHGAWQVYYPRHLLPNLAGTSQSGSTWACRPRRRLRLEARRERRAAAQWRWKSSERRSHEACSGVVGVGGGGRGSAESADRTETREGSSLQF